MWRDWSHELEMPVNRVCAKIDRAVQAVKAGASEDPKVLAAAFELDQSNRAFRSFAYRVKEEVPRVRGTHGTLISVRLELGKELNLVVDGLLKTLEPEQDWCVAAFDALKSIDKSEIGSEQVANLCRRVNDEADPSNRCAALTKLLRVYMTAMTEGIAEAPVAPHAFRPLLRNLTRNAVGNCDWAELVRHDPDDYRMCRVSMDAESMRHTIFISNPLALRHVQSFEARAECPPCFYSTWWRAVNDRYAGWGGRIVMHHVRRLREEYAAEEMDRWLVVTSYSPFTVELTLPAD